MSNLIISFYKLGGDRWGKEENEREERGEAEAKNKNATEVQWCESNNEI